MSTYMVRRLVSAVVLVSGALIGNAIAARDGIAVNPAPVSIHVMSVGRLLTHANGQPVTPIPPSVSADMRRSLAEDQVFMFVAGVIDSGEGKRWCLDMAGESRLALTDDLLSALRKEPLPDRGAAAVLAEQLAARFPCGAGVPQGGRAEGAK